jgi:hypothetical protein
VKIVVGTSEKNNKTMQEDHHHQHEKSNYTNVKRVTPMQKE